MSAGTIKIWSDGLSQHTKIAVVDGHGKETPLTMVSSIDFRMPANKDVGSLNLGFLFDNVVEIAMPADRSAVAKLIEADAVDGLRAGMYSRAAAMERVRGLLSDQFSGEFDMDAPSMKELVARIVNAVIEGAR